MSKGQGISVPVDLIRTIAILGVLLLHAANDLTNQQMNSFEIIRWNTVTVYQSLGRAGVPLFVMLTGLLLLQPSKLNEPIKVFFKKRWTRIALPFIFWGAAYFAWDFLVDNKINNLAINSNSIIQGILNGPYFHFWYLYMLMGLYLLTPILRVLIAHSPRDLIKYLLVVWFLGVAILPLTSLFGPYALNTDVFTIPAYAGYFILGVYLLTVKMKRSTLIILMTAGFALTAIGTYIIAYTVGGGEMYYFQEYLSPTMILASTAVFLLLLSIQKPSNAIVNVSTLPAASTIQTVASSETVPEKKAEPKDKSRPSIGRKLLHVISENTLPIFLFHIMILEALQRGYFGFTLNGNTVNSIIGVPITAALTLFICLAILVPLKHVPYLKNLIG